MKVYHLRNIKTWNEAAHEIKEQMLELRARHPEEDPLDVAGLQDAMVCEFEKLVQLIFHSKR